MPPGPLRQEGFWGCFQKLWMLLNNLESSTVVPSLVLRSWCIMLCLSCYLGGQNWFNFLALMEHWIKGSSNLSCRSLAEMAAATSVHVVAVIEPIIQHADWFFPGGEFRHSSAVLHQPRSPSVPGAAPLAVCLSHSGCPSCRWRFQCVWGVCGSSCCEFQSLVTHWEWLWMWDPGEEEASEHDCDGRGFAEEGKVGAVLSSGSFTALLQWGFNQTPSVVSGEEFHGNAVGNNGDLFPVVAAWGWLKGNVQLLPSSYTPCMINAKQIVLLPVSFSWYRLGVVSDALKQKCLQ